MGNLKNKKTSSTIPAISLNYINILKLYNLQYYVKYGIISLSSAYADVEFPSNHNK